jgi:hypothetical protein
MELVAKDIEKEAKKLISALESKFISYGKRATNS